METNSKLTEDRCPRCNSERITFGVFEVLGEAGFWEVTCESCGFYGRQWANIIFEGWTDENNDDME